jgi:hypothetical protein
MKNEKLTLYDRNKIENQENYWRTDIEASIFGRRIK